MNALGGHLSIQIKASEDYFSTFVLIAIRQVLWGVLQKAPLVMPPPLQHRFWDIRRGVAVRTGVLSLARPFLV
jgi:hypothetical protein